MQYYNFYDETDDYSSALEIGTNCIIKLKFHKLFIYFYLASYWGHHKIVDILLEHKHDLSSNEIDYKSALFKGLF